MFEVEAGYFIAYPEQNKRLYRYAGKAGGLVDIAAVSHPGFADARW